MPVGKTSEAIFAQVICFRTFIPKLLVLTGDGCGKDTRPWANVCCVGVDPQLRLLLYILVQHGAYMHVYIHVACDLPVVPASGYTSA